MNHLESKRVLFVRLGAIGDVVNALVVATALKERAPQCSIGWAIHDLASPLVLGHPSIDRVHLWKRGGGLGGWRAITRELKATRYDVAVDLQRIGKSACLARASGAPRLVGYDRARTKEQSWLLTRERIPPGDGTAHMVEQYMDMARHLGCEGEPRRVLPPAPLAEERAHEWLAAFEDAPIQVNLGASKPPNRWPPERFGELIARLVRECKRSIVLTGAPNERELANRALASAGLPGDTLPCLDLVGHTSLPELWSVSRRCSLFVGCDTGPMHLAAAVGTPVVALFGPAQSRRTGPFGTGHCVVQSPNANMNDLTVEVVLDAVQGRIPAC